MRVVFLENKYLKIGVLVDRGSDIFEFSYKPFNVDLILRLEKDIINPRKVFSQMRNEPNQFEEYYYGGWQEILPNSAPMNFKGAQLGQHGEVSLIPWEYSITMNSPNLVSLTMWTRPLRAPFFVEKTLTLKKDDARLYIDEKLVNESEISLHLMWGHHIAFGLPLVGDGAVISTNATKYVPEKAIEYNRLYENGEYVWPHIKTKDGGSIDASKIGGLQTKGFSELGYLSDFVDSDFAYYEVSNDRLTFSVQWDSNIFKSLWYWQERYATLEKPWWGKVFAVALEPWTSRWHANPTKEIMEREWLQIGPGESVETHLQTNCTPRASH